MELLFIFIKSLLRDSVIQRASIALGYSQLRPNQYEAVKLFLEGNDVFVVLPTGSGKALPVVMIYCHVGWSG